MPEKQTKAAREAVARVAYELYLLRGGEHGHDIQDWLIAEHMLEATLKRRRKPHNGRELSAVLRMSRS